MGAITKIEWCHRTFNPWWGCTKVSPACDHCYAEAWAKRTGHAIWGKDSPRRFFGDKHWAEPLAWDKIAAAAGERHRVFCASMADVMEDRDELDKYRIRLWELIEATPNLDWLLLSKRPQNFRRMLPLWWVSMPRPNVWLMTTCESNEFRWRVESLLEVPAVVHGVSYEPAVGPLDLTEYLNFGTCGGGHRTRSTRVDWVIAGGESGAGARPTDPEWFRAMRDDCARANVAFLFKQWGEYHPITRTDGIHESPFGGHQLIRIGKKNAGRLLDGIEHNGFPVALAT